MVPSLSTDPPAAQRRRPLVTLPEYRLGKPPANKGMKLRPEPLTYDEVDALLRACSRRSSCGLRMAAIIVVMWRGGLRIKETLDLLPKDADLAVGTLHVLHGKGDKERLAAIDRQACGVIERWVERRTKLGLRSYVDADGERQPSPLFCTISRPTPGRPLWHSYVRERLKELAAKAGIEKRVHPHGLRHTAAYGWRMSGVDYLAIQRQLGHGRLDTTIRYIDHMAPAARIKLFQQLGWNADAPATPAPDLQGQVAQLQATVMALQAQLLERAA